MSTITLERAATVTTLQKVIARMRHDPQLRGYAALMASMHVHEGPVVGGTACTDTLTYIRVAPGFLDSLTPSMQLFVLIHEVMHKWQGFFPRFEVWAKKYPSVPRLKLMLTLNKAGDYLINWQLKHAVGLELPEWTEKDGTKARGLYDAALNNNTYTMETLADKLMREDESPDKGGANVPTSGQGQPGEGGMGEGEDLSLPDMYGGDINNVPSQGAVKELEAVVRRDMANAARAAKAAGDESGFGEMMADESKKDKHNWTQVLYRFAAKLRNAGAPSFARPNRRYKVPGGRIQLPSRRSVELGSIAIIMDTSGSMLGELMSQVMAETKSVLKNVAFDTLYVMHVDARVKRVDEFKRTDLHKWTPKVYGGGGTVFAPAFKYAYRELPKLDALVYHTDGWSRRRDLEECEDLWTMMGRPPVLWAINGKSPEEFKRIAKFGTIMDCR